MFDHRKNLADNKQNRTSSREMARKLYLSYPTCVLVEDPETEYAIRNRFAMLYSVPLAAVQIIGSAKTGFSLVKKSAFVPMTSDLDVAIIDAGIFQRFWEDAYETSRGFKQTAFKIHARMEMSSSAEDNADFSHTCSAGSSHQNISHQDT